MSESASSREVAGASNPLLDDAVRYGSHDTGGQGPPSLPSTSYGTWRVADSYSAGQSQTRRATILLSIYLLVILTLPPEIQKAAKLLGVELGDIQAFPSLLTLALSSVIAHLCSTMARGARLARTLQDDLEVSFSTSQKLQIDVVTTDEFDESSLLVKQAGILAKFYFCIRVIERFGTYIVFLAVVFWSFWVAISQILELYSKTAATPVSVVGIAGSVIFLVLAALRLAQYWLLRVQTLAEPYRSKDTSSLLMFPRKYSLTSVVVITVATISYLSWHAIIIRMLRVVFLPLRARALAVFKERQKELDWIIHMDELLKKPEEVERHKQLRKDPGYTGLWRLLWLLYVESD